jgi:HPt (histidine-containing phosphotransfer) domain-containing protein
MSEPANPGIAYPPSNWSAPVVSAELFEGLAPAAEVRRTPRQALDLPQILERCLGSRQLVERVLQTFAERFAEDLELIRVEIEAGSAERTAKVAHRLKGAAANAAAEELAGLAGEIEAAARDEQLERAQRIYRELPAAWTRFGEAREAFKQLARSV